jgi:hypothetical protein
MGNCCNRPSNQDQRDFQLELKDPDHESQFNESSDAINPTMDFSLFSGPICLNLLFPESSIIKSTNDFFEELQTHIQNAGLIKSFTYESLTDCEFFALTLPKANSSELISVHIQKYKSSFSAEFMIYSSINQTRLFNTSLDEVEIIQKEYYQNSIYFLERYKTKKILMISPRNMITLRIFKKLGDGKFLEISQTIDQNNLLNHSTLRELYEKVKENFATTFLGGTYFEDKDTFSEITSYSRSDFHSSVSLKIVGVFIGKGFESYIKNVSDNANKIYQNELWKYDEKKAWFVNLNNEMQPPVFFQDKTKAVRSRTISS